MEKQKSGKKRTRLVILRSSVLLVLGLWMLSGQAQEFGRQALDTLSGGAADDGSWNLILVNAENPVPEGFAVELEDIGGGQRVDARIAEALEDMLQAARSEGLDPVVCSSYRTQDYQAGLYERKIGQYMEKGYGRTAAAAAAARWVAPPGTSEHQLGLAVDIVSSSFQVLDSRQEKTAEQQWLMEHCWEYGFILRYPSDKSDITGIAYEPWHYRYVGKQAAREIAEQGVCLEEYLGKA